MQWQAPWDGAAIAETRRVATRPTPKSEKICSQENALGSYGRASIVRNRCSMRNWVYRVAHNARSFTSYAIGC